VKRITLKELTLQGFRSVKHHQTIKFPTHGMGLIRGPSGVGKSNLAYGLAFALDYCAKPATVLKTVEHDGVWGATATIDIDSAELVSRRGDSVNVVYNTNTVIGSTAQKKSKLTEILGVSPELVQFLTFRPQRSFGLFLSMNDDKKKDFLSSFLGIDNFEKVANNITKSIGGLESDVTDAVNQINICNGQIDLIKSGLSVEEYQTYTEELSNIEKEMLGLGQSIKLVYKDKTDLKAATEAKVKSLQYEFDQSSAQITKELAELETTFTHPLQQEISTLKASITKVEISEDDITKRYVLVGTSLNKAIESKNKRSTSAMSLQYFDDTIKQAKINIEDLRTHGVCVSCGEPLKDLDFQLEEMAIKLQKLLESREFIVELELKEDEQIESYKGTLKQIALTRQTDKLNQLRAELVRKEKELNTARTDYLKEKNLSAIKLRDDLIVSKESIKNEHAKLSIPLDEQERDIKRRYQTCKQKKDEILFKIDQFKRNMNILEALVSKLKGLQATKEQADTVLNLEKDIYSVVNRDSFPAYFFEEVLAEIATEINKIVANVPNTVGITFTFGDRVTAKGKVNKNITPIVYLNGIKMPFSELSGGQASVLELATDLAIREVIARRNGVKFGWMVLDEVFDGLGKADKDSLISLLRSTVASDTLVLLVDHAAESQEMFDLFIDVSMENGNSTYSGS
jgi:DNA repair exonuclease SbcCD ATPase subunit